MALPAKLLRWGSHHHFQRPRHSRYGVRTRSQRQERVCFPPFLVPIHSLPCALTDHPPFHSLPVLCPGHDQLPKQRGIITYRLSPNRLRPLAGTAHAAVFNTFRRSKNQFLYVVPPFVLAYWALTWAEERYVDPRCDRGARRSWRLTAGPGMSS